MNAFLKRITLFFLCTAALIAFMYWWYKKEDPFQTCNHYNFFHPTQIAFNRDYISTQTFLQRADTVPYDAVILGSSRCYAFAPSLWRTFLPEVKHPFAFDASQESIYGIRKKLELLVAKKIKPKEVLLVFCNDATFWELGQAKGHLFEKHPALSGQSSFHFQLQNFRAFYNPSFLFKYISFKRRGAWDESMKGFINQFPVNIDSTTNELVAEAFEKGEYNALLFDGKPFVNLPHTAQLDNSNLADLQAIKKLLEHMGCNYHIVLSPLYAQIPFHPDDTSALRELFPQRVHDYSCRTDLTFQPKYYYEKSHYNKDLGKIILTDIYTKRLE